MSNTLNAFIRLCDLVIEDFVQDYKHKKSQNINALNSLKITTAFGQALWADGER